MNAMLVSLTAAPGMTSSGIDCSPTFFFVAATAALLLVGCAACFFCGDAESETA